MKAIHNSAIEAVKVNPVVISIKDTINERKKHRFKGFSHGLVVYLKQ